MSDDAVNGNPPAPDKYPSEREERTQGDPMQLVAAVVREMADPRDNFAPTPVWLLLGFLALAMWAGYYIDHYSAGFRSNGYNENSFGAASGSEKPKPVDPMVLGKQTFSVCMQCHQANGRGVPGSFPPLAGSPIVLGPPETPVRIVMHGLHDNVTVLGATYNGEMPSWDKMTDDQLAAVLTYVRNSFGNSAPPVDPALVSAIRRNSANRNTPWTWPEVVAAAQTPVPGYTPAPPAAAPGTAAPATAAPAAGAPAKAPATAPSKLPAAVPARTTPAAPITQPPQ